MKKLTVIITLVILLVFTFTTTSFSQMCVVADPPFGAKREYADRKFREKFGKPTSYDEKSTTWETMHDDGAKTMIMALYNAKRRLAGYITMRLTVYSMENANDMVERFSALDSSLRKSGFRRIKEKERKRFENMDYIENQYECKADDTIMALLMLTKHVDHSTIGVGVTIFSLTE